MRLHIVTAMFTILMCVYFTILTSLLVFDIVIPVMFCVYLCTNDKQTLSALAVLMASFSNVPRVSPSLNGMTRSQIVAYSEVYIVIRVLLFRSMRRCWITTLYKDYKLIKTWLMV